MKTHIVIYLIIVLSLFSSCDDFLKEVPKDFLSPNNLPQTEEDCDIMLNGVLDIQGVDKIYGRSLVLCAGFPGTDYNSPYLSSVSSNGGLDRANVQSTNTNIASAWSGIYSIINEVNVIISKIPEAPINEDVKEKYMASARFLRALYYFHLVRLWGPNGIYLDAPVEDFEAAEAMTVAGNVQVFYDLIQSDVEYAVGKNSSGANRIPTEDWPTSDPGNPTYGAAKTLQAKVYLTMAGHPINKPEYWQKAKDAAMEVKALPRYSLFPNVVDLFLQANEAGPEFIYSIQYDLNIKPSPHTGNTRPDEGWHFYYADLDWVDRYFDVKDTRRENYMIFCLQVNKYLKLCYPDFWGSPNPYPGKWKDIARERFADYNKTSGCNFPVFRTSEVYLMIAEAENEVNGPTQLAYQNLNAIRTRAGLAALSGISKDVFRQEVKDERMRELCFELKNRYDLHRWGDLDKEMLLDKHAAPNWNMSEDEYFPVPNRDALLNPNLGNSN